MSSEKNEATEGISRPQTQAAQVEDANDGPSGDDDNGLVTETITSGQTLEIIEDGMGPLPPPAAVADATPRGILEIIEDNTGPLPPTAAAEAITPSGILEIIEDNTGPLPPTVVVPEMKSSERLIVLEDSTGPLPPGAKDLDHRHNKKSVADKQVATGLARIDSVDEICPPVPFNPDMINDDDALAKMNANNTANSIPNVASALQSTSNDADQQAEIRGNNYEQSSPTNNAERVDGTNANVVASDTPGDEVDDTANTTSNNGNASGPTTLEQDQSSSIPIIPEAFLVEEDEEAQNNNNDPIIISGHAEPLLPWYKQPRAKFLLCIVFVIVVVLSIALGVSLSRDSSPTTTTTEVIVSFESSPGPSMSIMPTSSMVPSYSPTSCAQKILVHGQRVDFEIENLIHPKLAVNGSNMVVVAKHLQQSNTIYVMFYTFKQYSFKSGSGWESVDAFTEHDLDVDAYDVSLSGNTALVSAGVGVIYERNAFGGWSRIGPLLEPVHENHFYISGLGGVSHLVGDIACVGRYDIGISTDVTSIYVFRRDGENNWITLGMLDFATDCSITGNTIVFNWQQRELLLYEYSADQNGLVPLQLIVANVTSMDASNDHLVFTDVGRGSVFIGRRDERHQNFTLLQELNSTDYGHIAQIELAMDNDVLAIGGDSFIDIFNKQNGYWDKIMTLDHTYSNHHLSGRKLLVTGPKNASSTTEAVTNNLNKDVYSFDIADCTQSMPTQMPSFSAAPTTCHDIEISMAFPHCISLLGQMSWTLERIDALGVASTIQTYTAPDEEFYHKELMCLPVGDYRFTVGVCQHLEEDYISHYNVTTSNGELFIAQGKESAGHVQNVLFSLPFVETVMPSESPTTSLHPTHQNVPSD